MIRPFIAVAGLLLSASCSTTANARDIEMTTTSVLFGIEACVEHVVTGAPLTDVLQATAAGRKYEVYTSRVPGASLMAPNWKGWCGLATTRKADATCSRDRMQEGRRATLRSPHTCLPEIANGHACKSWRLSPARRGMRSARRMQLVRTAQSVS